LHKVPEAFADGKRIREINRRKSGEIQGWIDLIFLNTGCRYRRSNGNKINRNRNPRYYYPDISSEQQCRLGSHTRYGHARRALGGFIKASSVFSQFNFIVETQLVILIGVSVRRISSPATLAFI